MKDKYDVAVEYLTANPDNIYAAWKDYSGAEYKPSEEVLQAHCLFQFVTPTGKCGVEYMGCGCLTEIRHSMRRKDACTETLTDEIRADERIPQSGYAIKVQHLPIFAEWQRRIDKELNRI